MHSGSNDLGKFPDEIVECITNETFDLQTTPVQIVTVVLWEGVL